MSNRQPISYIQTDPRWRDVSYSAPGEHTTVGRAGCGPTCAAMLLTTLTGQTVTPVDTCDWARRHGFKARGQGTYYSYFAAQFAAYGINAGRLNAHSVYGKPNDPAHKQAAALLEQGYYLIACMGKGLWTSSGHYVVVWEMDGKVRINDPASTKGERLNGDPETFKKQVKYYFWVDARTYNKEEDMTQEQFNAMLEQWLKDRAEQPADDWAKPLVERAKTAGFTDGSSPKGLATRQEVMAMILAANQT